MCTTPTCTLLRYKWKVKVLQKRSQVTCYVMQLTIVWFFYSMSIGSEHVILNVRLHEDHVHTESP